jgi:hypothetical protein
MNLPPELYKSSTFWSLGSASGIVFVVSNVLIYLYPPFLTWKIVPFVISVVVSYSGVFMLEKRTAQDYVLALFNAFLLFSSATGLNVISSQIPPAFQKTEKHASVSNIPASVEDKFENPKFFQMWYSNN